MDASPLGCWRSHRRKCWGAKQPVLPEDGCGGLEFLGATPVSPLLGRWSRSARLCESLLEAGGGCGCYWSSEIADAEIKATRYWTFYFWVRHSLLSPGTLREVRCKCKMLLAASCCSTCVVLFKCISVMGVGEFQTKKRGANFFFLVRLREIRGWRDDIKNK